MDMKLDLDKEADKEITRMYSAIYFRRNFIRCLTDIFIKHAESNLSIEVFKEAWIEIKAKRLLVMLTSNKAKTLLTQDLLWIENNFSKILLDCKARASFATA